MLTFPSSPVLLSSRDSNPSLRFVAPGEESLDYTEKWVISVVRGTMHSYLSKLLEIPHINEQGTRQLLADLQYFKNVLAALDVSLLPEFDELQRGLSMPQDALKELVAEKGQESPVLLKVAAMKAPVVVSEIKKSGK